MNAEERVMSFDVVEGANGDAYNREKARRETLMRWGTAGLTVYLNGGSDTRRAVRDYWQEYARQRNIGFWTAGGCICVIGGPPS